MKMFLSQKLLSVIAVAILVICLQHVTIQLITNSDLFKYTRLKRRVNREATGDDIGAQKEKPMVIGKQGGQEHKESPPMANVPHYHENLHPPNLQLINITDFNIIINTDICNVTDIALVTIIHSAGSNRVGVAVSLTL